MSEQEALIQLYEQELSFLRKSGGEFSRKHPKIAAHLGIHGDLVEDPHVSRLLEGTAYLNARIQHKLKDDLPELTDALLGHLYPHYTRPIPSMSIAQLSPTEDLDTCVEIAKGTKVETSPFGGKTCQFKTTYPVNLTPLNVSNANVHARPFIAPGSDKIKGSEAVLHLQLETLDPNLSILEMDLNALRLYLGNDAHLCHELYESLIHHCQKIVITGDDNDTQPLYLNADRIRAVGFQPEEGLLPYPKNAFIGYRLLTEFFCFPEKFLFIDIENLGKGLTKNVKNKLNLYFYLNTSSETLEQGITKSSFRLNCTPIINLFQQTAEPISVTQHSYEYQVIPDARNLQEKEVFSIDDVTLLNNEEQATPCLPFYGLKHSHRDADQTPSHFWQAKREPLDNSQDVFLSLMNIDLDIHSPQGSTLDIALTCCNADIPSHLPFGGNGLSLHFIDADAPVEHILCITPPTKRIQAPVGKKAHWKLLSHLNINHLPLTEASGTGEVLKEILRLYNFKESPSCLRLIDSIVKVSTQTTSAPIKVAGKSAICRGTHFEITLNPELMRGSSALLFSAIIDQFLGLYTHINSFTQLSVRLDGHESHLIHYPPRAGNRQFI